MYEIEEKVIKILKKNKIDIVATVPCDKAKDLFYLLHSDPELREIPIIREEDGIGIGAGVYLAGGRPAIAIQSSGLGNCFNALLSLSVTYELPLPIIASWRGFYDEKIPAQIPFNSVLPEALRVWKIPCTVIEEPSEIGMVDEVIEAAYDGNTPSVALISPKAWAGVEEDKVERAESTTAERFPERGRISRLRYERVIREPVMTRYDAIKIISEYLHEEAVVSNIGIPSKELYDAGDRDLNFYMLGSYSQASSVGFGISLATAREVIVLDGDGSLLASNVLPVLAAERPTNLSIFCLDNGTLGSTGDQLTNAYMQLDLELMAVSAGINETGKVHTEQELRSAIENLYESDGPRFIHVMVKPGNADVPNIPLMPVAIKERVMEHLHGTARYLRTSPGGRGVYGTS